MSFSYLGYQDVICWMCDIYGNPCVLWLAHFKCLVVWIRNSDYVSKYQETVEKVWEWDIYHKYVCDKFMLQGSISYWFLFNNNNIFSLKHVMNHIWKRKGEGLQSLTLWEKIGNVYFRDWINSIKLDTDFPKVG